MSTSAHGAARPIVGVVARALLVVFGVACALAYRVWPQTAEVPRALAVASLGAAVLVVARVLCRSPLAPTAVPAIVALPLLSTVVEATLKARLPADAALAAAFEDTLRLGVLGFVLLAESLTSPGFAPRTAASREPRSRGRGASVGLFVALAVAVAAPVAHLDRAREGGLAMGAVVYAGLTIALVLGAAAWHRVRKAPGIPASTPLALAATGMLIWAALDSADTARAARGARELEPETVAAIAGTLTRAVAEVMFVVLVAIHALATARSLGGRVVALALALGAAGLLLIVRAPPGGEDPLRTAVDLAIDPPSIRHTLPTWVGVVGLWNERSPVLVLRPQPRSQYLTRDRGGPLREAPIPVSPPWRSDHPDDPPLVVLAAGSTRFDMLVANLDVLRGRRHGLWLAVAPYGWKWIGKLGRRAESAPTVALGIEPTLSGDGPGDDYVAAMMPEGRTLGLVVRDRASSCVELDAQVVDDRIRYTRGAACGSVSLEDAAADRRITLLRETGAGHILLAPEPAATLDEVVRLLCLLSAEITAVKMEGWERACPPPARCEPYHSWETGVPLVWLTTDRAALEPR